jgi:hypothetical protein
VEFAGAVYPADGSGVTQVLKRLEARAARNRSLAKKLEQLTFKSQWLTHFLQPLHLARACYTHILRPQKKRLEISIWKNFVRRPKKYFMTRSGKIAQMPQPIRRH